MRSRARAIESPCGSAALVALLAIGCGPAPPAAPNPGTLTVDVTPAASASPGLTIASGRVQLHTVTVFGDVAPDGRSMIGESSIDLLGSGRAYVFASVPQGLYSVVRFTVSELAVAGSYKGTPLHLQLDLEESSAAIVDLRSPAGVDVTPGHDGQFMVGLDSGAWFAGGLLDGAVVAGGQILVDGRNNVPIAQSIAAHLATAFSLAPTPGPM